MLLIGYAVGSLLAAGLTVAMYLSGQHLRQIFFYLLGSFAQADLAAASRSGLPIIVVGSGVILARARSLNALLLGDDTASHLGIDVRRERAILLGLASLVTAAAVALAGLIGFVGLVVPHVVRLLVGPNARLVLPLSALFGAAFLILADLVARIPGELPVGVVTALVGAPVSSSCCCADSGPGTSCERHGASRSRRRASGWPTRAREVLRGIDLRVGAGERVCLVGPNGAGQVEPAALPDRGRAPDRAVLVRARRRAGGRVRALDARAPRRGRARPGRAAVLDAGRGGRRARAHPPRAPR